VSDKLTAYLDAVEKRANAATVGPWSVVGRDYKIKGFPQIELPTERQHYFPVNFPEDADFIAASRTDVPRLLRLVRALLAEREYDHDPRIGLPEALALIDATDEVIAEIEAQL
jgi:hypothetical protein